MMVKFNIFMMLYLLEKSLLHAAESKGWVLSCDLTIPPESGDIFSGIPSGQGPIYAKYISSALRIKCTDPTTACFNDTWYVFIRNGKTHEGVYTRLSSVEIVHHRNDSNVTTNPQIFTDSVYKRHFADVKNDPGLVGNMSFQDNDSMIEAVKFTVSTLTSVLVQEIETNLYVF